MKNKKMILISQVPQKSIKTGTNPSKNPKQKEYLLFTYQIFAIEKIFNLIVSIDTVIR